MNKTAHLSLRGIGSSAQPNAGALVLGGARIVIPSQNIAHKFAVFIVLLDRHAPDDRGKPSGRKGRVGAHRHPPPL